MAVSDPQPGPWLAHSHARWSLVATGPPNLLALPGIGSPRLKHPPEPALRPHPRQEGVVDVPLGANGWRTFLMVLGPAYLVAVGYMDPGNWATDLAAGSS